METNALATPETTESQDINEIKRKMRFTGTVMKTTLAGAVVDIGVGIPGVVHISQLQIEPVNRVEDVIQPGQMVDVWIHRVIPKKKRIELTMIKPLDLEWREILKDMVVKGKVTRLEKFGVFVDIGAERPGLVHISEITHDYIKNPGEIINEGDEVEVKVLSVDKKKRQIKLSMKALEEAPVPVSKETKSAKTGEQPSIAPPEEKEEVIPTAMEMALREAMERNREQQITDPASKNKPKSKGNPNELEKILTRTLQQKVKTK
jgi:small subunit ribosomal protein S1